jgi:hypothetical protein
MPDSTQSKPPGKAMEPHALPKNPDHVGRDYVRKGPKSDLPPEQDKEKLPIPEENTPPAARENKE